MDFDFRNPLPESRIYHNVYDSKTLLGRAVLNQFNERLDGSDFAAEWMMVVTWNQATPYYWANNSDEVEWNF